ncbi:MAG: ferritin-like domain-containing protein, partial [Cyanobacteria bacterium NC_groundwater_1444_Ag_S-0.65um_54_12]|nr:ferritin-like domain-containing protein [Cyanobacteria bacterium NC_groundwater_1444_Ag_S-0.65um_54_12]
MPRTTTSKVTEILNCSISLEHGAIIQYLTHAYLLGESGIGAEIINIARTEMRHLKYFGDLLVDLGGEPDLFKRGPMFSDANSAFAMISNGITAETEAIKAYEAFCDELDHAPAQRIFTRVLTDERFHLAQFGSFLAPATELLATYPAVPAADTAAPAHAIALLNGAVSQEYRAILLHVYEHLKSRDFWLREHTLEAMN